MQTAGKLDVLSEPLDTSDTWESTISAWMDGDAEIRPEDLDSPYGRQVWETYHLIGDVLRSEELAVKPSELFYARLSKVLDDEPTIVAPQRRALPFSRLSLSGLAAAAVFSALWLAAPYLPGLSSLGVGDATVRVVASADENPLRDYIDAHRQFAGPDSVRLVSYDAGASH